MKIYKVKIGNEMFPLSKDQVEGIFAEKTAKMIIKTNRQGGTIQVPYESVKESLRSRTEHV
jgi:hypothetical protein